MTLLHVRMLILLALARPSAVPCQDGDGDGVCNPLDLCEGDDATGNADDDRWCDDRDQCWGDDATGDTDGDDICNDRDVCWGNDTTGDADADEVCNDRDVCQGDDATGDLDGDGVCGDLDQCWGHDAWTDRDGDGVCFDLDVCLGDDALGDTDNDQICEDLDVCVGDDATGDLDGDGVCFDLDQCFGDDAIGDSDGDGACDDTVPCMGLQQAGDVDGDGICGDLDPCDDTLVTGPGCALPSPIPVNTCGGVPVMIEGRHTGFVDCPDGGRDLLWETSGWAFEVTEREPGGWFDPNASCWNDSDCTAAAFGECIVDSYEQCSYGCDSSADCGANEYCVPPGIEHSYLPGRAEYGRGVCRPVGECSSSSDCASGRCAHLLEYSTCGVQRFTTACRTAADPCTSYEDCPMGTPGWGDSRRCWAPAGDIVCSFTWSCGRPLSDEHGMAQTAPIAPREDWAHTRVHPASTDTDDALAEIWCQLGAMEHASVASFARHMLELMSLGAPADLLHEAAAAQADEIDHAQRCFALASAYGGHPVGPGPLTAPPPRSSPADILRGLLAEGCVGETIAAMEAHGCAELATDPVVRDTWLRIADDETRHALLAWRTVNWMVQTRPDLAPVLREPLPVPVPADDDIDLERHGILTAAARARLAHQVMAQVVAPTLQTLSPRTEGPASGVSISRPMA